MRFVSKGDGDYRLNKRHASHLAELKNGTASPKAWDSFAHKEKSRRVCLNEQYWLCAFSETVLTDDDLGMHLDHVEPRSLNPQRTFDHANLVLCAISSEKLKDLPKEHVFGGHYRKDSFSKNKFISPFNKHCRGYFHYASDGYIEPAFGLLDAEREKARYTIDCLNLNSPLLVVMRRNWLQELEESIDLLLGAPKALEQFADMELCLSGSKLRPFHSAARERFGPLGERIIRAQCHECA